MDAIGERSFSPGAITRSRSEGVVYMGRSTGKAEEEAPLLGRDDDN